jgi:hypothetical protein
MTDIYDMLKLASDLRELGRCGFVTDFTTPGISSLTIGSAAEVLQLRYFEKFWKLVYHSMRSWLKACLRFSDGCPSFLAGLVSHSPIVVAKTMQALETYEEAYQWSLKKTGVTISKVTDRCPMQSTSMRFVVLYATSGKFNATLLRFMYPAILPRCCCSDKSPLRFVSARALGDVAPILWMLEGLTNWLLHPTKHI